MAPLKPLRVGVLLVDSVQLLDIAAVDLLYMTSPEYIEAIGMPKAMKELGRPCQVHYIGRGGPRELSPVTAHMEVALTDSLTSSAVAPGKLDVLFIPGPPPANMPCGEDYLEFLRQHFAAGAEIMSVCTAALVIAYSGITKGKTATSPRFLIPRLRKEFPETKLWDDSMRVVRDGNLWSCGGITNGHDLMAEYLHQNYPAPLVNVILGAADILPRKIEYPNRPSTDNAFFMWQILRSLPSYILRTLTRR
ncbi:uncharacterized protein N7469_005713 [Penicillium citrinum]|uniref:DJ-1/PfpI domain-containing protein n=2 Tax=Penicillium TaxID=5073 RepID=A0A9W9TPK7_PENCI|nr:uncharacterized protein N7469_005713 [Penicillium citrinum]KAJ5233947.1 hypothetical protein N7469_005713 [Penicillium citrinum]KAJ5572570.1 hypothetical protein N7450_009554 [Penicillium hetheringtonii]